MIHSISIQHSLGNKFHAAKNSYLAESSKVHKHCALSGKVQFATPVSCFSLLLPSSVPGLLQQDWLSGRRRLSKLPSELDFSVGGSNKIWNDGDKACCRMLFNGAFSKPSECRTIMPACFNHNLALQPGISLQSLHRSLYREYEFFFRPI